VKRPFAAVAAFLACPLATSGLPAAADDPLAVRSIALCNQVTGASPADRVEFAAKGLELGERAVKADDGDAKAHYAVFCNLGRQLEFARVSPFTIRTLRRAQREVDRALELDPNYPAALMGKGAMLVNTPGFLGGDPAEGLRLLRKAIDLAPDNANIHLQFAKALRDQDKADEARVEARKALELAKQQGLHPIAAEASTVLDKLGGGES
jgi:tetratricopeptide (TPR) repeat protein